MSQPTILWYFADPMCSWCWGFSPVMEKIRATYRDRLNIALMLGGLRPGTTQPMSAEMRTEILHHWHEVNKMTGQTFNFEGAMPEGFIYDTEPACRAVITLAEFDAERIFPYFTSIQSAFYTQQRDVTNTDVLVELAVEQGLETDDFLTRFDSEAAKQKTLQHFQGTRQAGVTGFPSLVLQKDAGLEFLTRGYCSLDTLTAQLETRLKTTPA